MTGDWWQELPSSCLANTENLARLSIHSCGSIGPQPKPKTCKVKSTQTDWWHPSTGHFLQQTRTWRGWSTILPCWIQNSTTRMAMWPYNCVQNNLAWIFTKMLVLFPIGTAIQIDHGDRLSRYNEQIVSGKVVSCCVLPRQVHKCNTKIMHINLIRLCPPIKVLAQTIT